MTAFLRLDEHPRAFGAPRGRRHGDQLRRRDGLVAQRARTRDRRSSAWSATPDRAARRHSPRRSPGRSPRRAADRTARRWPGPAPAARSRRDRAPSSSASVATPRGSSAGRRAPASPWMNGQDADDLAGLGVDDHRHVLVARLHRQEPDRVLGAARSGDEGPDRRGVLRLALRELGERPRALARRPAGTARTARRDRRDSRGRGRRSSPRSRCRPAASDRPAGARR